MERNKKIVKVSIQGIIVNIILVVFKSIVGLLANSIAIILDAVNNLSDAFSSIITIIGTKLSEKRPNKKHPFGYGRIEYFSSMIIAIIVLLAGITSLKESIGKIIKPERADYTAVSILIIVVAIFVKFFFGRYVKKQGEELSSGSLVASGTDAISDSILSFSTLVAAIISILFHISLEGYLGVIISIIILKSAIEIMKDTIDDMIGIRTSNELTAKLKKTIQLEKEVRGVYDITIHNYGPNKMIATAHIEIRDDITAKEIHHLTRKIELEVYKQYGILLTLGIYASNEKKEYKEIKNYLQKILKEYQNIIQMHGFYVDEEIKMISFDIIFSFDEEQPETSIQEIKNKLKKKYPKYEYSVILDADISE